eukprot:TRINITY_DN60942_c0_g1_i1.p1 TRINITY_DN60942_c0_g1~~TRINITY_DN60942_c0_g1_i1.p1  ORF type:complete len:125 (+),score=29.57 TRINITY_DN60942_c0_g1_i1:176-550(+)
MKRLWRMKDRSALKNLAVVPASGDDGATALMRDAIRVKDEDGDRDVSALDDAQLDAAAPRGGAAMEVRRVHYSETKLFKLSEAIASVIDGYGLVGFEPLDIHDQNMMVKLTQKIDNAMGNLFFA